MSFQHNLLRIFGIFLIISYFDGIIVLCDEEVSLLSAPDRPEDEVVKIIDECGNWDEQSPAPWIVTIFAKRIHEIDFYRYLCDGSIVTPNIIITAGQCFMVILEKTFQVSYDPDEIYVVAGKHNTNFNDEKFAESNHIQVKEYYFNSELKASHTKFVANLAVLVLQKPFQITSTVQPVCFDRNNKIELPDLFHNDNETEGWNINQYQYVAANGTEKIDLKKCLKKIDIKKFDNFLIPDEICPAVTSDLAVCWNIGGGIIVNNKQQFYIRGVIGFTPTIKRAGCDPDLHHGLFVNIYNYHEFLLQILDDHEIKTGDCPDIEIINHGKFELLGQNQSYKPKTPVRNYALIKYTCDTDYALRPTNPVVTCLDGNFTNPIPQCKRILKGAIDDVINLIDECGYWDERPPAPWNVAIYYKKENNYIFVCGGSIVTSNVIITAARCLTKKDLQTKLPAENFYVAAGKYYNDYNAEDDEFAQKSQVKEYHVPPVFYEVELLYQADLAVVILKNSLKITNVVQPACLDRNNKIEQRQVTLNNKGIVTAWNQRKDKMDEELKQSNSTYIHNEECLKEVTNKFRGQGTISDKFCAHYISNGNFGGGIAYKWYNNNKQQFYIRGVNTLEMTDIGNEITIGLFTNITFYKEFILKIIDQQLRTDSCPSIIIENGQVSVLGQDSTPTDSILNYNLVKLTCNANYTLHPASPLIACNDGNWNVPIPQCKLTCPPVISSSVDVTCRVDGNAVDCSQPLVEGTVARSKCKPFYTKSGNDVPISTCVNGFWSNPLIRCEPECGEVISNGVTNIVNGTSVKKGEFPWHIALYRLVGEKHVYKCGGSIINPLTIITAAHCFTDEKAFKFPVEEFYVGAGKYYSDYNSAEDIFAQKRQVKEYHIPSEYTGYESSYAADLAVVVVRKAFEMTNVVQPVCMDWDGTMESEQLRQNNVGTVVGWGYVDPKIPNASAELKQLNPPFIDFDQCLKEVPSNFRRWITLDKFCAGFLNGSSICKGDSGGGLVFKWKNNRDKYFLRGLVSVGPVRKGVCDDFQYGVYTKISFYNNFILNIIAANLVKN